MSKLELPADWQETSGFPWKAEDFEVVACTHSDWGNESEWLEPVVRTRQVPCSEAKAFFLRLRKDQTVWKKTIDQAPDSPCLTKLVLRAGTTVHVPSRWSEKDSASSRKLRADAADVISNRCGSFFWRPTKMVQSGYASGFVYERGGRVRPFPPGFSWEASQCDGGIHFFISPHDAKAWKTF